MDSILLNLVTTLVVRVKNDLKIKYVPVSNISTITKSSKRKQHLISNSILIYGIQGLNIIE